MESTSDNHGNDFDVERVGDRSSAEVERKSSITTETRFSISYSTAVFRHAARRFDGKVRILLHHLLPSFLQQSSLGHSPHFQPSRVSHLDGVRGWACLFVFNEHLTYNFDRTFINHGYTAEEGPVLFIQRPIMSLPWAGFSMVAIFFVISGFVLSYKPIQMMQAKRFDVVVETLSSSTIRRAFRLFLPSFIAVMLCACLVQLGLFEKGRVVYDLEQNVFELQEGPPPYVEGFFAQMADGLRHSFDMMHVWSKADDFTMGWSPGDYDLHLWTIPVEFRASMMLFTMLLGVSRMTTVKRMLVMLGILVLCFWVGRREMFLFTAGAMLAELSLLQTDKSLPFVVHPQSSIPGAGLVPQIPELPQLCCFVLGLWMCSIPENAAEVTPGFILLNHLAGHCDHVRDFGATILVYSVSRCSLLQSFFGNAFSAYLGKISYAMYLVHGNVLKSLLHAIIPEIYALTGDGTWEGQTMQQLVVSWLIGATACVPLVFWLSDLFWRSVDVPCVRLARWIEEKVVDDAKKEAAASLAH